MTLDTENGLKGMSPLAAGLATRREYEWFQLPMIYMPDTVLDDGILWWDCEPYNDDEVRDAN